MKFWKHYDIMKNIDETQVLYLRRYFIWRCKWFNIFLHYIPKPDFDTHSHNHPWPFFGLVLSGGYTERLNVNGIDNPLIIERNWLTWAFRRAREYHKIMAVKPNTWTLIITGPVKNEWKFLTAEGEITWRKYLGIPEDEVIDMD